MINGQSMDSPSWVIYIRKYIEISNKKLQLGTTQEFDVSSTLIRLQLNQETHNNALNTHYFQFIKIIKMQGFYLHLEKTSMVST